MDGLAGADGLLHILRILLVVQWMAVQDAHAYSTYLRCL